ncbi:MAG: sulfur carrier protein ThiS [Bacteroidetes bacterium]|nr:sulfur carrier protein ThiS [Bacteroidota bacterium]
MKITLNNTSEEFGQDVMTVNELLKVKTFTFKMLVVRINGILVKKDEYSTAVIKDKDDVMVLHLVSGG